MDIFPQTNHYEKWEYLYINDLNETLSIDGLGNNTMITLGVPIQWTPKDLFWSLANYQPSRVIILCSTEMQNCGLGIVEFNKDARFDVQHILCKTEYLPFGVLMYDRSKSIAEHVLSVNIQRIECAQLETESMEITSSSDETEEEYPDLYECDDDEILFEDTQNAALCYYSQSNLNEMEVFEIINAFIRPFFKRLRSNDIAQIIQRFYNYEPPQYVELDIAYHSEADVRDEKETNIQMATKGVVESDIIDDSKAVDIARSSTKNEVTISVVADLQNISDSMVNDDWFHRPDANEFDNWYISKTIIAASGPFLIIEDYFEQTAVGSIVV